MSVAIYESPRIAQTTGGTTPRIEVVMLFQTTFPLRHWSKIQADSNGCWIWSGPRERHGYGRVSLGERAPVAVHRVMYAEFVGPLPKPTKDNGWLQLDHLCRVEPCCNPRHLELVTSRENTLRGVSPAAINARRTRCPKGHEYTEANTVWFRPTERSCRTCVNQRVAAWKERTNYNARRRIKGGTG